MYSGGGATPWGSWISCEESNGGKIWQVDPLGKKPPRLTALGTLGKYGKFCITLKRYSVPCSHSLYCMRFSYSSFCRCIPESFAFDRRTRPPTFYVTRDDDNGVLTRFIPNAKGLACYDKTKNYDRWCTLEHGTLDYLVISGGPKGTFRWTTNKDEASENAKQYFPGSEGIDAVKGRVYFVSKEKQRLVILDLKRLKYTYSSTKSGAFDTQPDQIERLTSGTQDM